MAAHDLRNPLAVIQSTITLIYHYADRLSSEKLEEKYEQIQTSIDVMVRMLDDILIYEKAESGKIVFEPAPLNVITFCQDMAHEIGQAAHATQRIMFLDESECDVAFVDAKLLRHILSNLLSNALKYSPADCTVTFAVQCGEEQIAFRIEDQGIGIPKKDQKRLFETFHRGTNARKFPGTGLGLAIVKQSVELHGGIISFESEEGRGTTFTVVIPQIRLEK
jgi:signal transduction histidine kinase